MNAAFIHDPILNSPLAEPTRYWERDEKGMPTAKILSGRRRSEFIVPLPPPRHKVQAQGILKLQKVPGRRQPNDYISEIRRMVGARRAWASGAAPSAGRVALGGDFLVPVARACGLKLHATAPSPLH